MGRCRCAIETSLAPFTAVYDEQGTLLASNGSLDGKAPVVPLGVLRSARATGRDAVTWQPRAGVRVALVVLPWHGGTIAAGRSLRVIETRIDAIGALMGLGWLVGVAILVAIAAGVGAAIWPATSERFGDRGLNPLERLGRHAVGRDGAAGPWPGCYPDDVLSWPVL